MRTNRPDGPGCSAEFVSRSERASLRYFGSVSAGFAFPAQLGTGQGCALFAPDTDNRPNMSKESTPPLPLPFGFEGLFRKTSLNDA